MVACKATDEEIRTAYLELRSVMKVARKLGMASGTVHTRMREMGIKSVHGNAHQKTAESYQAQGRIQFSVPNGKVIVFSDAHYWPGYISTAHRALLKLIPEIKPKAVICNGDAFDGAAISRFPRLGWDHRPTVKDELAAVVARLGEIEKVAKGAKLFWPAGNHDARFETYLAAAAPQYEGVRGFHLKDYFPFWAPCWSVWINQNTVVKHRWKGGIHATRNNTVNSGLSIVTGHLHSLKVAPFSDYRGTRYGVDSGTLSDPYGPQYEYTEDNPVDWRSGFVVLSFVDGELLAPQLVSVRSEGVIEYRGDVIRV